MVVPNSITGTGTVTNAGGAGNVLDLNGVQDYATLNANAGTTNVNNTLGAGTCTVNANGGTTNFSVSQTLAALNIAAGATVVLTASPAPAEVFEAPAEFDPTAPVPTFENADQVAAVPEPGALSLMAAGVLGMLSRQRRRSRA